MIKRYKINNSQIELIKTAKLGEYKITTYWPQETAPLQGWPIIYLLDGDSFFLSVVAMLNRKMGQNNLLANAIVVAIDYAKQNYRDRDYLPNPPQLIPEILPNGKTNVPQQYGGADQFLQFIDQQVRPMLAQRFTINPQKQTLFGHSYGGLLVLHALFTSPTLFNNYVAASPSIWFSDCYILSEALAFIANYQQQSLSYQTRLMVSVGGREQSLTKQEALANYLTRQRRLQHKQNRKMIDNSQYLVNILQQANLNNLILNYQIFPNQTHFTAPLIALQDALYSVLSD